MRRLASISSSRMRGMECSSSAFCRENAKLPLHECVREWLPISCPAATARFQPSRCGSMADGTTKSVTLAPCRAKTGRPSFTWLTRPSSKLRLSAIRAPPGHAGVVRARIRASGRTGSAAAAMRTRPMVTRRIRSSRRPSWHDRGRVPTRARSWRRQGHRLVSRRTRDGRATLSARSGRRLRRQQLGRSPQPQAPRRPRRATTRAAQDPSAAGGSQSMSAKGVEAPARHVEQPGGLRLVIARSTAFRSSRRSAFGRTGARRRQELGRPSPTRRPPLAGGTRR